MPANEFAEELKKRGNEAFAAKRYEDAIVLYDRAIETDPDNYVYYNNRAAANHELKHYDKAIEDAKKALSLEENAKSHQRIAAALWGQNKLTEARAEFEKAIGLEPANANAKQSIELIDRTMSNFVRGAATAARRTGVPAGATMTADGLVVPPPQGGEFTTVPSGVLGIALDVLVAVSFAAYVVSTFLQPAMSRTAWNVLMSAAMAQQLVVMRLQNLLKVNKETMSAWFKHFSSLLMILCFMALLTGIKPQLLVGGFIAMYAVLDLAAHRAEVGPVLGPLAGVVMPYLDKLGSSYEQYVVMAATFESVFVFAIPLTGGTWFTLVYIQYVINRYKTDRYVQTSFMSMRQNVLATAQRYLPAVFAKYLEKFCKLLHTVSKQSF